MSVYKSLFVPFSTHGDQSPALAFASALANVTDATVTCAFASKSMDGLDEAERNRIHTTFRRHGYTKALDLVDDLFAGQFAERVAAAKKKFETFSAVHGHKRMVWGEPLRFDEEGATQMQHECGFHDLTIVSNQFSDTMFDDVINATLFGTGRPLALIRRTVAAVSLKGLTVLLAWKNTPQTLRAQWFALPVLKAAGKVIVTHVVEDESEPEDFDRVTEYLKAHGIKAESKILFGKSKAEQQVEDVYTQSGAELLVMGAYSHARWRQNVFGGFTRHFLRDSDCNLFMAH